MKKIDFKKELKQFYNPSKKEISIVDVPKMNFLMIDGKGDPNISQEFKDAISSLYPVAYTLKFMAKKGDLQTDYGVMPLEGLWWSDNMKDFVTGNKKNWSWTLMIMQPDFITKEMFDRAFKEVKEKKKPALIDKVRFESFKEGKSAQILYLGAYKDEGITIKNIHERIKNSGHTNSGKHHEIYLSDFRKTSPDKLKTIIRQPFQ